MSLIGVDVLGAVSADYGAEFGPLSPAQLAQLNRALIPTEQAAVTAWQSNEADTQLATERAKGGPRSETVSVTSKGAVVRATAPSRASTTRTATSSSWKIALIVLGGLATAGGVLLGFRALKGKRRG